MPQAGLQQAAHMQAQTGLSRWGVIRQAMGACQAVCWINVWPPGRLDKLCVNLTCQQQAQHQGEEHACGLHLTQHRRRLTALTRDLASGWEAGHTAGCKEWASQAGVGMRASEKWKEFLNPP